MEIVPETMRVGQYLEELMPKGSRMVSSDPSILEVHEGNPLGGTAVARLYGRRAGKVTLTVTLQCDIEVLPPRRKGHE